jgi:hypothetical protein
MRTLLTLAAALAAHLLPFAVGHLAQALQAALYP